MVTRIRELLEARQLSPTQFADLIGVGRPVISHILSERNKPSLEVVQRIISSFPEVSLPWLLTGSGAMLAADNPTVVLGNEPISAASAPTAPSLPPTSTAPPSVAPPPTLASSAPAAPTTLVAAPQAAPAAFRAPQPTAHPLPPKFRPGARTAGPAFQGAASPADQPGSVSRLPAVAATQPLAVDKAPNSPAPATSLPPAASVSPATPLPAELLSSVSSAPAQPLAPPAAAEPAAPLPGATSALTVDAASPAAAAADLAALSFLGEPGKAIRRIVIFYRDGSFSDYLPEG